MKRFPLARALAIITIFLTGFISHFLYQRWNSSAPSTEPHGVGGIGPTLQSVVVEPQSYPLSFAPWSPQAAQPVELPVVQARDVGKIRALAGQQARIRGRVYRVGHSAKSDTHFLNFGPSREALTAVIFASAVELFQKNKLPPKNFAGKEVELQGEIKDHPQYGLEIILEHPSQIKVVE